MKTRLPKALLLALLASSSIYAEEDRTGAFLVKDENIISTTTDVTENVQDGETPYADKLQQGAISGSVATAPLPIVKDGAGELTINGVDKNTTTLQIVNPIVVREGTLKLQNVTAESKMGAPTNFVPYISIGGKSANLVLDGANVQHYSKTSGNNSVGALNIGTADGAGHVVLVNGSLLHTDHVFMAGDPDGQRYNYTHPVGTGYVKYTYSLSGEGENAVATRYSGGDSGQSSIKIYGGSTVSAGTSLQFSNVNVLVSGVGSKLIDNTSNTALSGGFQGSYFGYETSYEGGVKTDLTIEKGASYECNWNLYTGGRTRTAGLEITDENRNYVNITVGSKEEEGKTSTMSVAGHLSLGGNLCVGESADTESLTTFTVMGGAKAYLNVVTVGQTGEGKAIMEVGAGSSILKHNAPKYDNNTAENTTRGETAPVIRVGGNGTLINKGTIDLDITVQSGGTYVGDAAGKNSMEMLVFGSTFNKFDHVFTALDGSIIDGLVMTTGTINISGNVKMTNFLLGEGVGVEWDDVFNSNDFKEDAPPLTFNIDLNSVIDARDSVYFQLTTEDIYVHLGDQEFDVNTMSAFTILSSAALTLTDKPYHVYFVDSQGEIVQEHMMVLDSNGRMVIPEPATATLSLLALMGLAARRRRTA